MKLFAKRRLFDAERQVPTRVAGRFAWFSLAAHAIYEIVWIRPRQRLEVAAVLPEWCGGYVLLEPDSSAVRHEVDLVARLETEALPYTLGYGDLPSRA